MSVSIWIALLFLGIGLLTGWNLAMIHANVQIEEWTVKYWTLAKRVGLSDRTRS